MSETFVQALKVNEANAHHWYFYIECKCGNKLEWKAEPDNKWDMHMAGVVQFKCPKCGKFTTFSTSAMPGIDHWVFHNLPETNHDTNSP